MADFTIRRLGWSGTFSLLASLVLLLRRYHEFQSISRGKTSLDVPGGEAVQFLESKTSMDVFDGRAWSVPVRSGHEQAQKATGGAVVEHKGL